MAKTRTVLLLTVGIILGAGVVIAATSFPAADVPQSGDVSYNAGNGPNVTLIGDLNTTGQMFPVGTDDRVQLNTTAGNLTAISNGDTDLTVQSSSLTGDWCLTSQRSLRGLRG